MNLTYRAFGLSIRSELPLPGLPETLDPPEIVVRRGLIPEWHGEPTIRYGERCKIRGQEWSVRFKALPFTGLIRNGNSVQFEADPSQDEMASLHVLGSCTGALLFQRGFVPLHGNTVTDPHGTALIAGKVGAGKSSTTFALLSRDYNLVADDISAVSFETAAPEVIPGFPRLKLWKATLDHFGCDPHQYRRLRIGMDKFYYPVDDRFSSAPQRLDAVYVLHPGETSGVRILPLSGVSKLDALRAHLYKIRFQDAIRNWPPLLGKLCRLADTVRVNIVERPRDGVTIEEVAKAIASDMEHSAAIAI